MDAQQVSPAQANIMARNLIVGSSVKRTQQIKALTVDPAAENVLNISPRNVGLILGFIVSVQVPITVAVGGTGLKRTPFGPANVLRNVQFYDLNNNTRLNTSGRHLSLVNSARSGSPYLAARENIEYPASYGQHYDSLISAPDEIKAGETGSVNMTYFVPLAYSEQDLRGAVYANVVNATMNLQLTINRAMVSARNLAGNSDAVYVTTNAATAPANVTVGNAKVTVYQVYYDQLPTGPSGVVLPILDLSTIYELKETTIPGITPGQDFPMPYSNFRDFLSTFALFRNRAGDAFAVESDLNSIALESANYTNLFKVEPRFAAAWGRQTVGNDFPAGVFYIPSRTKPISTVQYGNMSLIFNAADVQPDAVAIVGYEAFALVNMLGQAQSLAPA